MCFSMSYPQEPSTSGPLFFYPPEYYVFDNFSSFQVEYNGVLYPTAEHAYQAAKFVNSAPEIAQQIAKAKSAHEALKIAEANDGKKDSDWAAKAEKVMKEILLCKVNQHEYVKRKLLQSGDREIIEDSWRDSTWGWGADHQGQNKLGKLWMEICMELQK